MRSQHAERLVLAFMALVTLYFLALVFAGATGQRGRLDEIVAFGFGAAFGLEFLWSSWTELWEPGGRGSIG
jgi:hypothetical protein